MTDKLALLISQQTIKETVKQLAQAIDYDYENRSPVVVGVLKGSFIFLADLIRQMQTPIKCVELIKLSSYGSGTVSSGQVSVQMDLSSWLITGEDVLLIEDMVDTGSSSAKAFEMLQKHHPKSLKLCTLLDKPERRKVPVTIDYLGLTIPDKFIVGYGIDFDEKYRQLPDIYSLETMNER